MAPAYAVTPRAGCCTSLKQFGSLVRVGGSRASDGKGERRGKRAQVLKQRAKRRERSRNIV